MGKSYGHKQPHNCLLSANWQLFQKDVQWTRVAGTKGNVFRLDQQRPLQFHTKCCRGDVLANTQDLHNELPESHTCQVRSTAALPQMIPREALASILLLLSVIDTQAGLVCLLYSAAPHYPRISKCLLIVPLHLPFSS